MLCPQTPFRANNFLQPVAWPCSLLHFHSVSGREFLGKLGTEFNLNASELGTIAATAFWGFPLAVVIGGYYCRYYWNEKAAGNGLYLSPGRYRFDNYCHGYWTLFLSTLLIGIANGTVEAACNPLVASLFTDNKTTKLNHFHLWFPGGIVIGTLIVFVLNKLGVRWQIEVGTMLIPTLIYGYLFFKLKFPGDRKSGCRCFQQTNV